MSKYLSQQLRTTNDVNGNPRRLWLVHEVESGATMGAWDEGYLGSQCLPEQYRGLVSLTPVTITPGEYRNLLRQYRTERTS